MTQPAGSGMPFTAAAASELLTAAGYVSPAELVIEQREERRLARLPRGRIAWFADSPSGLARLATERRVLRLLAERCKFRAPRLLHESPDAAFDVRDAVPGSSDPQRLFETIVGDSRAATRIGRAIGGMLAEQHTRIGAADVAGWLRTSVEWPESRASIAAHLPTVIADAALIGAADGIMRRYEEVTPAAADLVLAHTDLGMHNIAVDAAGDVVGIFDYDSAALADRQLDFRYLVFHGDGGDESLFVAAAAEYERQTGFTVDRARVLLYNAACAVGYLAYRAGIGPDVRWCGRTLDEDLRWTRRAIARALGVNAPPGRSG